MTKLFVANKSSFGAEFFGQFDSLDELKRGIVEHEHRWDKESVEYTEELFKKDSVDYTLYEVDLHDDEYIHWHEYDGQSHFDIQKKDPQLLSIMKRVD